MPFTGRSLRPNRREPTDAMKLALTIFRFLTEAAARGERAVLVTLTDVIGSSSRSPGTHMAVSETGAFAGSLSGGCVEAAVVAEARDILKRGKAELVRFGAGSRYIDIRLPCGGGIDLLFTPDPSPQVLREAASILEDRQPVSLIVYLDGGVAVGTVHKDGWSDRHFAATHFPDLRLLVVGHGSESRSLVRLASIYSAEVELLSPDAGLVEEMRLVGVDARVLPIPGATSLLKADAFTAVVFLFHDHDWEPELMGRALATPAFFVGAMGSRATAARRRELLVAEGVAQRDADRVVGPIRLIPATRDPDTLALSILAQVAASLDAFVANLRSSRAIQDARSRVVAPSAASGRSAKLRELAQ